MRVLLTGGCGFIGSHQAVVLLERGHDVTIVDDLSNSRPDVLDAVEQLTGRRPRFAELDVRDAPAMTDLMVDTGCEAIVHFAGLKHVAESMERPVDYLHTNLAGLTATVTAADRSGVRKVIFSSSGSIYGAATTVPIPESAPAAPSNPYSFSKATCEEVLATLCRVDPGWSVMALRYFNPAGAHPSGLIGEDPTHLISNIVPVLMEVASGARSSLTVHGTDYDTMDGTCVRDYVHVMDVADAHARALDRLGDGSGFQALNIGRGEGVSVRQLIDAAERAIGAPIPVATGARRPGDVPTLVADTKAAEAELGPMDYQDIDAIFADAWRFRSRRTGT